MKNTSDGKDCYLNSESMAERGTGGLIQSVQSDSCRKYLCIALKEDSSSRETTMQLTTVSFRHVNGIDRRM